VPIVRTFITVMAGVGRMDRRRYLIHSTVGGLAWTCVVVVLGSLLGRFAVVRNNIELMLVTIVVVSLVPIGVEFIRNRRRPA
jgi:membrane-associated protein